MAVDTTKMKKKKKTPSMTKRIRDVKRLLAKDTLDDKLRQVMEKRLRDLLAESEENRKKYLEKKFAVRYHKIRFFERIKLERRISKLRKGVKHASSEEEKEGFLKRLAAAQEDLEYVLHFPKGEKYVSVLRDADTPEAQTHLESERKRLRALVKQKRRDEAIVNEINEGLDTDGLEHLEAADRNDSDENEEQDELMNDDFFAQSSEHSSSDDQDFSEKDEVASDESEEENRSEPFTSRAPVAAAPRPDEVERYSAKRDTSRQEKIPKVHGGKQAGKPMRHAPKKSGQKKKKNSKAAEKQPLRTRAEGGRKRRKKK